MKRHLYENNRLWDYEILSEIGRGCSGQVFKVKLKRNNKIYALKKINISTIQQRQKLQIYQQIKALKQISHPNIIQYYQYFLSLQHIYMVMQYADGGDLKQIVDARYRKEKYYTQQQLWILYEKLLNALKYLHQKHIIHRDIKLQNIFMMKNGQIKVAKFQQIQDYVKLSMIIMELVCLQEQVHQYILHLKLSVIKCTLIQLIFGHQDVYFIIQLHCIILFKMLLQKLYLIMLYSNKLNLLNLVIHHNWLNLYFRCCKKMLIKE